MAGENKNDKTDQKLTFPELPGERPEFEDSPLTRTEYITALAHIARGEKGGRYSIIGLPWL